MTILLEKPIRPGDLHQIRILPEAFLYRSSIDYASGDNIFIHIKPLLDQQCVVLNDFIDGKWRDELRIPLAGYDPKAKLDIYLHFHPLHVSVRVGESPATSFRRGTPLLETERITFPETIDLFQSHEGLKDSAPTAAEPSPPPGRPRGSFGQRQSAPSDVDAAIAVADCMHVAGRLIGQTVGAGSRLVALVDGRPSGTTPVEADRQAKPRTWTFQIEFSDTALVADGMNLELLLEEPDGEQRSLATTTIKSAFLGGLDRCSETLVRGWASNPHLPSRPLSVDIFLNGTFQGSTRCDRHREDLAALDPALAACGFVFKFPQAVFLPESADVAVSVRFHNTDRDLQFSPWWICRRVRLDQAPDTGSAGGTSQAA